MMSFWAYMLHCRGSYFYVGHTDNLELRVAQHQTGQVPGFAADHRPVELVWSEYFQTRDEAKTVEKQIKGWSRAKKMALIRGEWGEVSRLAKGKDSPSTSSGKSELGETVIPRTDHPELVEGLSLLCHPDTPSLAITGVNARFVLGAHRRLTLDFRIVAPPAAVILPKKSAPIRRDGLWKTTCMEMFVGARAKPYYCEYNYSPSGEWAAYKFSDYRTGMSAMDTDAPPKVLVDTDQSSITISIEDQFPTARCDTASVALSAVIEETDGTKSYWALRHPPGPPDFHHADNFALILGVPGDQL
jgi:predicted GIY-YIG superfamily endonuclease